MLYTETEMFIMVRVKWGIDDVHDCFVFSWGKKGDGL